jgi:hypothetical protein
MPYTASGSGSGGGNGGNSGPTPPPVLGYHHEQPTPASEWRIVHRLGFRPAGVQVTDADGDDVLGVATHPDLTTTVIRFAVPLAGTADLS